MQTLVVNYAYFLISFSVRTTLNVSSSDTHSNPAFIYSPSFLQVLRPMPLLSTLVKDFEITLVKVIAIESSLSAAVMDTGECLSAYL